MKRIICAFNTGIGSANKVSGSSITLNNDLPQNVEIDTNHIITKLYEMVDVTKMSRQISLSFDQL